jgi:hypothetical protein
MGKRNRGKDGVDGRRFGACSANPSSPKRARILSRMNWHLVPFGAVVGAVPGAEWRRQSERYDAQGFCPAGLVAKAGLRWCGASRLN